jgi:hypothetical protein
MINKKSLEDAIKLLQTELDKLDQENPMTLLIVNNLMWSDSIGEDLTFDEAKDYAKKCRDGGYTNWRVPTAKELVDTIDWEKGKSAITRGAYGNYWSSSQDSATYGWNLTFNSSNSLMNSIYKADGFSARCVRDLEGNETK